MCISNIFTIFVYQLKGKEFIMTAEQQRALRKLELFNRGNGFLITDPINEELLKMIIEDALAEFKKFYGRYNKKLLAKGFRSYRYEINGNILYIETPYKSGCKCGQAYDMNRFL